MRQYDIESAVAKALNRYDNACEPLINGLTTLEKIKFRGVLVFLLEELNHQGMLDSS